MDLFQDRPVILLVIGQPIIGKYSSASLQHIELCVCAGLNKQLGYLYKEPCVQRLKFSYQWKQNLSVLNIFLYWLGPIARHHETKSFSFQIHQK